MAQDFLYYRPPQSVGHSFLKKIAAYELGLERWRQGSTHGTERILPVYDLTLRNIRMF